MSEGTHAAALPEGLPYVVVEVVGQGASAVVYRARHATHGGEVALKVYRGPLDERARAHFRRECELQWQLSDHPNIVRLLDAAAPEAAEPWTVMPLYDLSLAAVPTDQGPVDAASARRWALDVLHGLAAVHDAGLLHRDIKPSNVLVKDGTAALADFGCALDRDDPPTEYGAGTPGYLAPELFTGTAPSTRSDVYSAAVTLRRLFGRDAPAAVDDLLTRAASYDPDDRPADGRGFLDAFDRVVGPAAEATGASPASTPTGPVRPPPRDRAGGTLSGRTVVRLGVGLAAVVVPVGLALGPGRALWEPVVAGPAAEPEPEPEPETGTGTGTEPEAGTDPGAPTTALLELARLPAADERNLVSVDGGPRTTIWFENRRAERVGVVWLDRRGRRRTYLQLRPGARGTVTTFVGHPWLVTTADGAGLFAVLPQPGPGLVTVT